MLKETIEELFLRYPKLFCLETGTTRSVTEGHNSTLIIGEALGSNGHLLSLDNCFAHINVSMGMCAHLNNTMWHYEDSLKFLNRYHLRLHFVYLDSLNDADHIWQEFKLVSVMMVNQGIILIDDAGLSLEGRKLSGSLEKKGHKVYDVLVRAGVSVKVVAGSHGTQLQIDFKGQRDKILLAVSQQES